MNAVAVSLALSFCSPAASPAANPDPSKAAELVKKLSDSSFRVRELAAKELVRLGAAAKVALEEGTRSSDADVADRCKKLLPQAFEFYVQERLALYQARPDAELLKELPGARRWLEVAGNSKAANDLYIEMLTAHRELLLELQQKPKSVTEKYNKFVQEIYQRMRGNGGGIVTNRSDLMTQAEMVMFLFLGTDPNNERTLGTGVQSYLPVFTIMNQSKWTSLLAAKDGVEPVKKLFCNFVVGEKNPNILRRALQLAGSAELKECIPIALKVAKDKSNTSLVRGYALTSLAKMGDKNAIKELQPLLEEKTVVTNINLGNGQRTIEIRDIAAGICLLISKQTMTDFGFERNPPANISPTVGISYIYFNFGSDEKREEGLKKWREFWDKEQKR